MWLILNDMRFLKSGKLQFIGSELEGYSSRSAGIGSTLAARSRVTLATLLEHRLEAGLAAQRVEVGIILRPMFVPGPVGQHLFEAVH